MRLVFFYLLLAANLMSMVHLGLYMVGANAYDVMQFRRGARKKAVNKPVERKDLPLLSVVIPAHNEELVIRRTLDSVRASSYPNFEIIVVDDGSKDRTDAIVREYIQQLPTTRMASYITAEAVPAGRRMVHGQLQQTPATRVVRRHFERVAMPHIRTVRITQTNGGKAKAMNNAIANHARGEFVMCLDADSILHPQAIERAIAYFADPKIIGVAANVRVMESKSIISTVQRFEHMVGYRSKKFYSMTNSEFIIGGVASTYRISALKRVDLYDTDTMTEDIGLSLKMIAETGNRDARIIYAADVVAMTEGVQSFRQLMRQRYRWKMGCLQNLFKYRQLILSRDHSKYNRMLTMYRLPMSIVSEILLILQPLMLAYIVYVSVHFHTLGVLLGGYLTITAYVLWTVWPDEHLTLKQKLRMSRLALVIYGLFYIMDIVQIAAILHCLKDYKQVMKRNGETTWISPTRVGQAA
ncbi:MAG TPA: glycosyltransferase [Candidatus Saccharimonadales bacterium]|nr:glycosyltransferase [Candidatus Saccharimonadales bacterium]